MAVFNSVVMGTSKKNIVEVNTYSMKGKTIMRKKAETKGNRNTPGVIKRNSQVSTMAKWWQENKPVWLPMWELFKGQYSKWHAYWMEFNGYDFMINDISFYECWKNRPGFHSWQTGIDISGAFDVDRSSLIFKVDGNGANLKVGDVVVYSLIGLGGDFDLPEYITITQAILNGGNLTIPVRYTLSSNVLLLIRVFRQGKPLSVLTMWSCPPI